MAGLVAERAPPRGLGHERGVMGSIWAGSVGEIASGRGAAAYGTECGRWFSQAHDVVTAARSPRSVPCFPACHAVGGLVIPKGVRQLLVGDTDVKRSATNLTRKEAS